MGKGRPFIGGFVTAAFAAGITVLLSTPKSGKEMRVDMQNKWDLASEKMIDMKAAAKSLKDSVSEFTKNGIPAIQSSAREMKIIINTWKHDIEPNIERISEKLKALNDERSKKVASK